MITHQSRLAWIKGWPPLTILSPGFSELCKSQEPTPPLPERNWRTGKTGSGATTSSPSDLPRDNLRRNGYCQIWGKVLTYSGGSYSNPIVEAIMSSLCRYSEAGGLLPLPRCVLCGGWEQLCLSPPLRSSLIARVLTSEPQDSSSPSPSSH